MSHRFEFKHGMTLLFVLLFSAPRLAAAPGDVLETFDSPCKYPTGMATDGKTLFIADWRVAKIYHVAITDGKLLNTWDAPTLKPHGLAYGGGLLYVSDDLTGRIYAFNPATGVVNHTFEAPGKNPTGLAYAKDALYILESQSKQIYKVVPRDGTILGYTPVPDGNCACLAFDGKYLWTSNRVKDEYYMFDPETGMVVNILASPGQYPAGLVRTGHTLWNVDFQTRKIYQIKLNDDDQPYRRFNPREERAEYSWTLMNYGPGRVRDVTSAVAIPHDLPNQELLSEVRYLNPPSEIAEDQWKQSCALFRFDEINAGQKREVSMSVDVRLYAVRYFIDPDRCGVLDDIPDDVRRDYTVDGERYRINSPYIQETVRKIVGKEENPYWIARKIFNFLIDKVEYEMVGGWDIPEVVIKRGKGSCSEYTFAFIAMCRAAGLPARYQGSVVVRGDDASVDDAFHRWAEIYLPNYGWAPIDVSKGDSKSTVNQCRAIGELDNRFLITTHSGGGSKYLDWYYNGFATYRTEGYCNTSEENYAFWEPLHSGETESGQKDTADSLGQCKMPGT